MLISRYPEIRRFRLHKSPTLLPFVIDVDLTERLLGIISVFGEKTLNFPTLTWVRLLTVHWRDTTVRTTVRSSPFGTPNF